MDHLEIPAPAIVILFALLLASAGIYIRLIARIASGGAKVSTEKIAPADMGIVAGLATFFFFLATANLRSGGHELRFSHIVENLIFFVLILGFIFGFLGRRVGLIDFFGLRRVDFPKAILLGGGLLLAAFPLVSALALLTQIVLRSKAKPQDVVVYFQHLASTHSTPQLVALIAFAVLIGPACEETIFRGYFYPTLKRYFGTWIGVIASAALFAFIHANLATMPPLFALAICLAIAYEITGSLAVPYIMHAAFNLSQLALLFATSRPQPPI